MRDFRNVHEFDGSLNTVFSPEKTYSLREKNDLFLQLRERLVNRQAKFGVNLVIRDLSESKDSLNFDDRNNLDCSDILAHICDKIKNTAIDLNFIEEQLRDMVRLGRCPQGRTTRFLQIWMVVKGM